MRIRICPKCAAHNPENTWSCANCGETLSLKTLVDATNTKLVSEISEKIRNQIEIEKALALKNSARSSITEQEQQNKKLPFAVYAIYVISALTTNWIFSTITAALIVFGIEKAGGDVGAPAIVLVVFLFINGILSIIISIIMGIAKAHKKEFPAKFSALVFIFTYLPFHILGLYVPDEILGSLASPVAGLSVYMLFFSFVPFFHMVSQGLINMYEFIKKRKTPDESIGYSQ
jgi:uncharacterized membrane protein